MKMFSDNLKGHCQPNLCHSKIDFRCDRVVNWAQRLVPMFGKIPFYLPDCLKIGVDYYNLWTSDNGTCELDPKLIFFRIVLLASHIGDSPLTSFSLGTHFPQSCGNIGDVGTPSSTLPIVSKRWNRCEDINLQITISTDQLKLWKVLTFFLKKRSKAKKGMEKAIFGYTIENFWMHSCTQNVSTSNISSL